MFFIFPDMFSREKTLSFLSHGLLPVPNVKSSSLYRTTNITTLVKQTNKKNPKKTKKKNKNKKHCASDGYCIGRRSQLRSMPASRAHTGSKLEMCMVK